MRFQRRILGIATLSMMVGVPALTTGCAAEGGDDDVAASEGAVNAADPARLLSASFDQWKQRFAAQVDAWRLIEPRLEAGRLPVPNDRDGSLGIDYVYLPAKSRPTNLVVMSSGIHGVEAPAGVVFQDVLLGECASANAIDRDETAILVLHVLNPYGAKHGRRFNGNNVDLNRNFFDAPSNQGAAFAGNRIVNQEYRDVRHLLEGGRISIVDILASWLRHGSAKMTKALSGQYEFADGIYFGGKEVQREAVALQELLVRLVEPAKNVAVLDVHTGLGKEGINQIMTNPVGGAASAEVKAAYEREKAMLATMFPADDCHGLCEVQLGAEPDTSREEAGAAHTFLTTGDYTQWFHERFAEKRKAGTLVSVTSEIGTTSARAVLEGLVDENYCFHDREAPACGEAQYQKDVKRLRTLFNSDDAKWRAQVVRAARQMCTAVGRFSRAR
ncbi:MAG: DUF2817 domain-containing protein [Deltaproteobacteria bacterium]|nr:DUF2817 domain-containing protein [Deltaproteobacteria bacterium]